MTNTDLYNTDFYKGQMANSYQSAKILLEALFSVYRPTSVVDFGCGAGTWLSAASELNKMQGRYVGLDGDWGSKDELIPDFVDFRKTDFHSDHSIKEALSEKFDLAISLEVAEHLPDELAETFINSIAGSSNVVLFGAAIPGQGGVNHINEQYQSYWYALFKKQGYDCIDFIRPVFWSDTRVGVAYRQNTLLYVKAGSKERELFSGLDDINEKMLDLVHPIVLERHTKSRIEQSSSIKQRLKNYLRLRG